MRSCANIDIMISDLVDEQLCSAVLFDAGHDCTACDSCMTSNDLPATVTLTRPAHLRNAELTGRGAESDVLAGFLRNMEEPTRNCRATGDGICWRKR